MGAITHSFAWWWVKYIVFQYTFPPPSPIDGRWSIRKANFKFESNPKIIHGRKKKVSKRRKVVHQKKGWRNPKRKNHIQVRWRKKKKQKKTSGKISIIRGWNYLSLPGRYWFWRCSGWWMFGSWPGPDQALKATSSFLFGSSSDRHILAHIGVIYRTRDGHIIWGLFFFGGNRSIDRSVARIHSAKLGSSFCR